jgi:bifunctional non-homologous end joining protein LigD
MNFQDYVKSKRKPNGKVKADIMSRWQSRIVSGGLSDLGEIGAEQYIDLYGKSIGAQKCVDFANLAEDKRLSELALGFWRKAHLIEFPKEHLDYLSNRTSVSIDNLKIATNDLLATIEEAKPKEPADYVMDFPEGMMPGQLVTSQPTDAQHDREYYIANPAYWGQPKKDGHKVCIFATREYVWAQSRSLKLRTDMPTSMKQAFQEVAKSIGSFIIEGEMYHLDWKGNEHMTAATAQAVNERELAGVSPRTMFAPFGCLFIESAPNGGRVQSFKRQQVETADIICQKAYDLGFRMIDRMPTYRTEEEKRQLVARQQEDGREGEIFFRPNMIMRPGKITSRKDPFFDGYVRCKYRVEPLEVVVTDVLPSSADGHFIGGIEVAKVLEDGTLQPIGRLGTGYSRQDQQDILERWNECQASGKVMKIKVTTQGWSAYGNLRHGSFAGIVEE